jgi:hypothetical protein
MKGKGVEEKAKFTTLQNGGVTRKILFFFTCCGHCLLGVRRSLIDGLQLQINGLKKSLENLTRNWLKVAETPQAS